VGDATAYLIHHGYVVLFAWVAAEQLALPVPSEPAGRALMIVDLRHALDFEADAVVIPGAVHLSPEELEPHSREIPRDRDVILYCT
jgi:rhodanese-related sulfurtransferase